MNIKTAPHIFIHVTPPRIYCENCQEYERIYLPVSTESFKDAVQDFKTRHINCQPRKKEKQHT